MKDSGEYSVNGKENDKESVIKKNPKVIVLFLNAFPAFRSRNYQLYFSGQLTSLIGTWLQIVAMGWLVLKMTNSAFLIGLITALGSLPSLFFTLFGGVLIDRFPKKKILFITQSAAMVLAFILGILTVFQLINIWEIGVIAFLLGTVAAIDIPARQAFVSELVTKDQLSSAIALNSATFNAARVIGPGIAGLLIAWIGTGGAFLINALSYIAVIAALILIKTENKTAEIKTGTFTAIKEGLAYSFSHPVIRLLIIFTAVSSVFGWSYSTVMPLIAEKDFHMDASGLGYMYTAGGFGALMATLLIGIFSKKISSIYFIIGGNSLFSLSIIFFSYTSNLMTALILLFFAGFGLLSQFAMINTTIQRLVKSEFRGRVLSIYIFMFMGLTPLGNFEVGLLSEHMGTGFAIRFGAFIVFLFGILVYFYRGRLRRDFIVYKNVN